jgi:hypothetical protein
LVKERPILLPVLSALNLFSLIAQNARSGAYACVFLMTVC